MLKIIPQFPELRTFEKIFTLTDSVWPTDQIRQEGGMN
jgi:hypothetical protein